MRYIFPALLLFFGPFAFGQYDDLVFRDHVYMDNIRTVKFHVVNLFTSLPIIRMQSDSALVLSFDDLDDTPKFYRYKVIHCTQDWKPSDLDYTEYVDGYNDESIDYFEYSINTRINYAHYSLSFPNEDMRQTKSGNYLLVVYQDDGELKPAITRRFMVVDPTVTINSWFTRPADVSKLNSHQEIDFEVNAKYTRIIDPKEDIAVMVLQNGRWDNALTGIRSKYERGKKMVFDYQNKIVFGAGKDFRNLDISSTQYRSEDVFEILRYEDHIEIIGEIDKPRTFVNFLNDKDINGQFVILNRDDAHYRRVQVSFEGATHHTFQDISEHDLKAEYLDVYFTLDVDRSYDEDVYIFGALTDWQLLERFKMTYDHDRSAYTTRVQLKQGFYDYIYVLGNTDGSPDETTIEGHRFEATNMYTILVYHHPFGGRYDQLIGAMSIETFR